MVVERDLQHIWDSTPWSALAAIGLICYTFVSAFISRTLVPRGLPWVGSKDRGPFWRFRAALQCVRNPREMLGVAYEKYLKKGQTYIYPTLFGASEIIIPNDKLQWLLDHPDAKSSVSEAHYDMLAGDYAFTDPAILRFPFHEHVIHRNLSRKLGNMMPSTWDEAKFQVDEACGRDTENWQELCVFDAMVAVVAGVSNRMLIGLPLCRNKHFQALNMKFAAGVMLVTTVIQLVPRIMWPIMGRLAAIPNQIAVWQAKKIILPVVYQRLADMNVLEDDKIPDDYITWHVRLARELGYADELDPHRIATRIMPLEFASIHTTTFTITNVLFDLLSSDPKLGYIDAIREEAERVLKEEEGVWSKQALAKMIRTDSAIRESMRTSGFAYRGVHRKVMAKDGIKGDGWTAPYGSIIATDIFTRHHDPSIYPDPHVYDALRFSRMREGAVSSDEYLKAQKLSLISTGDAFLPFGHGRHACPGRFFINLELKLLLAYMFVNYDFQHLPERPPNTLIGEAITPPMKATIKMRRRVRV